MVLLLLDGAAAGMVQLRLGMRDTALDWFRSLCVCLDDHDSASIPLLCGVPQGSILGPYLLFLHLLHLGFRLQKHSVTVRTMLTIHRFTCV